MKKRLALLLALSTSMSGLGITTLANTLEIKQNTIQKTTCGGIVITNPPSTSITTKVITTSKGTLTITDDGNVEISGDIGYNSLTGDFDTVDYINGHEYGVGGKFTEDYSFISDGRVYGVNKGDIYTRTVSTNNATTSQSILPEFSFMIVDDEWVCVEKETILYPRYKNIKEIGEKPLNGKLIKVTKDTLLKGEDGTEIITEDDAVLILTEDAMPNYITGGRIAADTIINYPDGRIDIIGVISHILEDNYVTEIQDMYETGSSCFYEHVLNKVETPPVTEEKPTQPSEQPSKPSTRSKKTILPQKLDSSKQYSYNVVDRFTLKKDNEAIKLTKGDTIILPKGTQDIQKGLPKNTIIIKNGKRIKLGEGYSMSRQETFKEVEVAKLSFKDYMNNVVIHILDFNQERD